MRGKKPQIPNRVGNVGFRYLSRRKVCRVLTTRRQAPETSHQNRHSQMFMEMTEPTTPGLAHHHARWRAGSRSDSLVFQSLARVTREATKFTSASRADFAIRGFAISFLTLTYVAIAILS